MTTDTEFMPQTPYELLKDHLCDDLEEAKDCIRCNDWESFREMLKGLLEDYRTQDEYVSKLEQQHTETILSIRCQAPT